MKATQQTTLRGWKEIAAHVGRDVRTVQRWEDRGLPVRRLPGAERGNVYALVAELDAWLHPPLEQPELEHAVNEVPTAPPAVTRDPPAEISTPTPSLAPRQRTSAQWTHSIYWASAISIGALLAIAVSLAAFQQHRGPSIQQARALTAKPEAHALYLRGVYFCSKRTPDSLTQAFNAFQKAAEIDPSYSDAFTGLAQTYELLPEYTETKRPEAFPKALDAARRAVLLNPESADAHRVLAFALFYWEWKTDLAEKEFRTAELLEPKSSEAFHWHADALLTLRRMPEARRLIAHARELDPNSSSILADQALIESIGSPDITLVVRQLQELQAAEPQLSSPSKYLSDVFFDHRLYSLYVQSLQTTAHRFPTATNMGLASAALNAWSLHSEPELLKALQTYREQQADPGADAEVALALVSLRLGDTSTGVKALERAYGLNDFRVISELLAPATPSVAAVPAFQQMRTTLLDRMSSTS